MTQPCPGYPVSESVNPPAHKGGYCCWYCDHDWDDARCTCLEPPTDLSHFPLKSAGLADPKVDPDPQKEET